MSVRASDVLYWLFLDEAILATHQVYESPDGQVWDAMLNQTNIGKNANKYASLSVLSHTLV